jgi:hypothetical protein
VEHAADDGQIVVVRPRVLETVGHVLGNMFQRIYHLIERAREADGATATQLEGSARRLEDFLQLVIDYVSPLSLSLQRVSGNEIAQSLAGQLSDATGCPVSVEAKLAGDDELLVDPGRLARCFRLLASQLQHDASFGSPITLRAVARPGGRFLVLSLAVPGLCAAPRTSESEMRWSVAEKLLEINGGSLQQKSAASGEVLWEISLPFQP